MKNKTIKIVYLASGKNRYLDLWKKGEAPSNSLYGFNFLMNDPEIDFCFLNIREYYQGNFFLKIYKKIKLIKNLEKYDIVILHQYLDLLFLRFFFKSKNKWVIFNINLVTLLSKSNKVKLFIWKKIIKSADFIINLSNFQERFLISNNLKISKMKVVKFGVDNDFYQKNNLHQGYILSVGLDAGRDFKTLVEAISLINKKVIIISPQRNLKNIKNFPKNLVIIDSVDKIRLRSYYSNAQIIVVPSKASKKIGSDCSGQTVLLEALASGKPVVTNLKEWIIDYNLKDKLIIYQTENPKDLREKINSLINNKDLYENLSYEGRQIIENKLNSKRMMTNMKKQLLNLIK
ncbi:glycosyltransferase family 4 protein [Patescibacteria group bacterium]|nr:glycosyltransferase family 4 protein [Patescibacteria group bacterium]